MEQHPMHKILAALAALGLLILPIQASAQTSKQPAATNDTAAKPDASAKKAPTADTSKASRASKTATKREAGTTKNKRIAKQGHKLRYARAGHGKRFVRSHHGRIAYGYSDAKSMYRHHRHHHRVAYGRGCR
jgi:cytoskeletal protein RodZ